MNLETKTVEQINIVQEQIADIISVLINTQGELINLITENRALRRQVAKQGTALSPCNVSPLRKNKTLT